MDIKVIIKKDFSEGSRILAFCTVILGGMFALHEVALIKKRTGELFVGMPSKKDATGVWRDLVHPINVEGRKLITDAVLKAYQEYLPV